MLTHQVFVTKHENRILDDICEGMTVYDWDDKKVGIVNYVEFPNKTGGETTSIYIAALDRAPADLRNRLIREGFIQVESGIYSPVCFISPQQIHEVGGNHVKLNVIRSGLIRF